MEVVQVLESRSFLERDSVIDAMSREEARSQMTHITSLSSVRAEGERVEAALFTKVVEVVEVDVEVEEIIRVWRVGFDSPLGRLRAGKEEESRIKDGKEKEKEGIIEEKGYLRSN